MCIRDRTNIYYMPTTAENGFSPALPREKVDVIYLCSPDVYKRQ